MTRDGGAAGRTARRAILLAAVTAGLGVLPASASAATYVVSSAADEVDQVACVAGVEPTDGCSLREAIAAAEAAPGADEITFAPALAGTTIELTSAGEPTDFGPAGLLVTTPITITGPAGDDGVAIARAASAPAFRVFSVAASGSLTLERLTVSGGLARGGNGGGSRQGGGGGGGGFGGAILNEGTLALRSSTLSGNTARGGTGGPTPNGGSSNAGGGGGSPFGDGGASVYGCCGDERGAGAPGGGGIGGYTIRNGHDTLPSERPGAGGYGGGGGGGGTSRGGSWMDGAAGGFGGGGGGSTGGGGIGPGTPGQGGYGGGAGGTGRIDFFMNPGGAGAGGGGAGFGGAIYNLGGTLDVRNSTLAANTAQGGAGGSGFGGGAAGTGAGGAIFVTSAVRGGVTVGGSVTIASSTIAGNASAISGGVHRHAGDVTITSSIVGKGTASTANEGSIADGGHNQIGVDSALDAGGLRDYGGPTRTWAPAGAAVDGGATTLTTDQRGVARPFDGDGDGDAQPDAGAFEAHGTLGLDATAYALDEAGGTDTITVRRTGSTDGAASVVVRLAGQAGVTGDDYAVAGATVAPDGTADVLVAWASGDGADKTVTVTGRDDADDEGDERLTVSLVDATGLSPVGRGTAALTIADDDAPRLSVLDATVTEGDDGATTGAVTLRLDRPTARGVGAGVTTAAGTATAGTDYDPAVRDVNLALRRPAIQTSDAHGGVAARANDGITDGAWISGSVSHTADNEVDPYWQTDLGAVHAIGTINVWGRTDCCVNQGANVWVLVSDTPLPRAFADAKAAATFALQTGAESRPAVVPVNVSGRYVRIAREGSATTINLAEVEVLAPVGDLRERNLARGKATTQTSTLYDAGASRAVDGNTSGEWNVGSVMHTAEETDVSWEVDLGAAHDIGAVEVWGRTDAAPERSANLWVLVSDTPLPRAFADARAAATYAVQGGATARPARSDVGARGRYVRVQREGTGTLNLAEVRVLSAPAIAIPVGAQEATVPVTVLGDERVEDGETFHVDATDVTNAVVAQRRGTVTIADDDHAPTAVTDDLAVDEDAVAGASVADVLANDSDADGDTFALTGYEEPAHGTVTRSGDGFTYVPDPDFAGADPFTYTVEDEHGNASTGTVAVAVREINDAPVLAPIADLATDEDVAVSGPVSVADVEDVAGVVLSARATAGAEIVGSVGFTGSGGARVLTVTPAPDASGTATIAVTATDAAGDADVRTLDVEIAPVNDAPRLAVADASTVVGVPVAVPVTLVDVDDPVAEATLTASEGTVAGAGAQRSVTVTPGSPGAMTVTLRASDAHGAEATRTFAVRAVAAAASPVPVVVPPAPAPRTDPPARPRATVPVLRLAALRVSARGVLAARLEVPGAGRVTVKATTGSITLARVSQKVGAAGSLELRMPSDRAAQQRLAALRTRLAKAGRRPVVTVVVTVGTTRATAKVTLPRVGARSAWVTAR